MNVYKAKNKNCAIPSCAVFIYEVRPSFTSLCDIAFIPSLFLLWPFFAFISFSLFTFFFLSLSFFSSLPFQTLTLFIVVVRVHYNPRRWNSLLLQPPPSFWLLLQLLLVVTSTLKPSKNGAMVRFYSSIVPSLQPINTLNLYRLGSRRS